MKKAFVFVLLCAVAFTAGASSAFAAKDRYKKVYVTRPKKLENEHPFKMKKDLPNASSYYQVSRSRPTLTIDNQVRPAVFVTGKNDISCNGKSADSCTRLEASFKSDVDCERAKIVLTVAINQPLTIELSGQYPQGTCPFDMILKHELAHEAVYRSVLKAYTDKIAQKMLLIFEDAQDRSKDCAFITENTDKAVADVMKEYEASVKSENNRLDKDGTHAYDFSACRIQRRIDE